MEKNVTLSVNMSNRETTKSIFKRMIGTWTSITQKLKCRQNGCAYIIVAYLEKT